MINRLNLNKSNFNELKNRFLFLFFSILIFRLGSFIPIPGINTVLLSKIIMQKDEAILNTLNIFSGGSFNRASIFSLGVIPYISASIIVQLLTFIFPFFKEIKKQGESGSAKINEYIRYMTFFLAFFQSLLISFSIKYSTIGYNLVIRNDNVNNYFNWIFIVSLITGTIFLMWLGELITEKGIGNGISVFIFIGIISSIPSNFLNACYNISHGNISLFKFVFFLFFLLFIIYIIVYIECSKRQITIFYARHQYTNRFHSNHNSSYLPLKLNISGVIPAIFASSILTFPILLFSFLKVNFSFFNNHLNFIYMYIKNSFLFYAFLYSFLIMFFCFFYSLLIFNPKETADNLKKNGSFIPGIRPGVRTENYIKKILLRVTSIGSIYVTIICLLPDIMKNIAKIPFHFSGTSLLIIVVVIIEFISQIQVLMLSSQYKNALKKSNLYFNKKNY